MPTTETHQQVRFITDGTRRLVSMAQLVTSNASILSVGVSTPPSCVCSRTHMKYTHVKYTHVKYTHMKYTYRTHVSLPLSPVHTDTRCTAPPNILTCLSVCLDGSLAWFGTCLTDTVSNRQGQGHLLCQSLQVSHRLTATSTCTRFS